MAESSYLISNQGIWKWEVSLFDQCVTLWPWLPFWQSPIKIKLLYHWRSIAPHVYLAKVKMCVWCKSMQNSQPPCMMARRWAATAGATSNFFGSNFECLHGNSFWEEDGVLKCSMTQPMDSVNNRYEGKTFHSLNTHLLLLQMLCCHMRMLYKRPLILWHELYVEWK